MSSARRIPGWVLFVLLVVMPLVELFVLIRVGKVIGAGWTILLLIAAAFGGAWVVRREGARAWRAFNAALAEGRTPARELADGVLVLVGGILMMAPGLVSDAMGLVLVLPFTRPLVRPLLVRVIAPRINQGVSSATGGAFGGFGGGFPGYAAPSDASRKAPGDAQGAHWPRNATHPGPQDDGPVVRGEVVDD